MDILEMLSVLEKKGVSIDIGCVYQVVCGEGKVKVAYQGVIEIDKEKICE